jgi:hypothetical protein
MGNQPMAAGSSSLTKAIGVPNDASRKRLILRDFRARSTAESG